MILRCTVDNVGSLFSIVGVGSIWKLRLDVGAFCLELKQYILLSLFTNLWLRFICHFMSSDLRPCLKLLLPSTIIMKGALSLAFSVLRHLHLAAAALRSRSNHVVVPHSATAPQETEDYPMDFDGDFTTDSALESAPDPGDLDDDPHCKSRE